MPKTQVQSEKRFADIETLLLWEGEVGNARLRQLYDIGTGAASILLRAYREAYPSSCRWNSVRRTFEVPPTGLNAQVTAGVLDEYAHLISRTGSTPAEDAQGEPGVGDARERAPLSGGVVHLASLDLTKSDPVMFRALHQACRKGLALSIRYASMRNPMSTIRRVAPKVLVQVGRRWHLRAYDMEASKFKEFTLGRIDEVILEEAAPAPQVPVDTAWTTSVTVKIAAHPDLSPDQARVIRNELLGGKTQRAIECRAALAPYAIQEMRAALDVTTQRPPDYQIVVANADRIRPWLFPD